MKPEEVKTLVQNCSDLTTTYLGTRESRMGVEENIGISDEDRLTHVLGIGATGTGKTQAMVHAALQDIQKGRGICFINPKGDVINQILEKLPEDREDDVVYINPDNPPVTPINPLKPSITSEMSGAALENQKEIIVGDILAMFKRQSQNWGDQWPRILSTLLRAHLDLNIRYDENNTLADVLHCVSSDEALTELINRTSDANIRSHLIDIRDNVTDHAKLPLKRRIQDFMGNDVIRRVIDAEEDGVDIAEAVTQGKIILVDVQRGKIGRNASPIIGSLVITQVWAAAQSRVGIPLEEREMFSLFIDEAKHYMSESSNFDELLSEAREYRLSTWIATQYIDQLDAEMQRAVVNNCRTKLVFQPEIADDGSRISNMLLGVTKDHLQHLGQYRAFLQSPGNNDAVSFSTFPPWTGSREPDEVLALKKKGTKAPEQDKKQGALNELLELGPGDNAGKVEHTRLLQRAKEYLEKRPAVKQVNLEHQMPGAELPDGVVIKTNGKANLEAEVSTLSKPARVLTNLKRAVENDRKCIFVAREGTADLLDNIISDPVDRRGDTYEDEKGSFDYYDDDGKEFTEIEELQDAEYRILSVAGNGSIRDYGTGSEPECPELKDGSDLEELQSFCMYREDNGHCTILETECVVTSDD
ncbi:TraM recognition domain-containing protein [Halobacteria archaeon AArc-curdl1]|uniref:TraM recognition domain-containing protein n=1 Tax=Natronosalvus hydrolyticus TaxID=2979988 RepID=A0AAP2ZAN5_9EURY|nr:TraM recognition domain-containing protein [Halobacteria archaeon AArc-curdl1]